MSQNNPLPRRKPFQIYVPIHRRNNTQSESASPTKSLDPSTTTTINANTTSSQDDGLVRRGRGRFRAPSSSPTSGHSPVQSPCISNDDEQQQQQQQQQHSIVDDNKSSSGHSSSQSVSNHPMSNGSSPPTPTKNTITDDNLATAMEKSLSLESKEDWEQLDDELEQEDKNNEHPLTAGKSKVKKSISSSSSSTTPPPPPIEAGTTILDCSGFPASFKTYHIQDMFRIYEDMPGSFKIKWMDDTRALIIFGSAATAKRAYIDNINNPTAKIRPYTGAVEFTASTKGEPIPQRPVTTDMVARRLVHGALGMKRPTRTREQLQQEKDMLQSIREQREAKKQQAAREANEISNAFFG
ncbi:hypothetical protein RO3G_09832 [Lichtheimia corymbifera JMRC:FSU:9682]|uniref:Thc1 RRM domain-containing protein n=1 Tax=Lichtheimia corymbifera JMRC:FSU:9682 TaxID=1263082 RepID=A0A068RRW3_9FUNG|nr:hypothetical protein RO3G_09832 [Lichtheimia corymbifera JMRC:FSU:9682]